MAVRLEETQILAVKRKALDGGLTVTEVVQRLLDSYLDGKINVRKREAPSE